MNKQENKETMSTKEKITTAAVTVLFAVIGAILGIIAYQQQWLG